MGAGASTADPSFDEVRNWTKEEVGDHVAPLGKAFERYRDIAVDNGIDGEALPLVRGSSITPW